jgi:hypothetical protein
MGARCRGLLEAAEGDLDAALASCERALEAHERMPVPFERARTLLIYGTVLRRARRRRAAREAIEAALSIFEGLPAPVWADNARAELARIGGRATSGEGLTGSEPPRGGEAEPARRTVHESRGRVRLHQVPVHERHDGVRRSHQLGAAARRVLGAPRGDRNEGRDARDR